MTCLRKLSKRQNNLFKLIYNGKLNEIIYHQECAYMKSLNQCHHATFIRYRFTCFRTERCSFTELRLAECSKDNFTFMYIEFYWWIVRGDYNVVPKWFSKNVEIKLACWSADNVSKDSRFKPHWALTQT